MLYGASPDYPEHDASHWGLQPAMTLACKNHRNSRPSHRRHRGLRQPVSPASAPLRIGVVACGYADGYPRHAPTGTPVLVDGVRTR
jgi:alanine racemase